MARRTKKRRRRVGEYHYQPRGSLKEREVAAYRKTFLIIVVTVVIIVLGYYWGIPFVGNLNNFWQTFRDQPDTPISNQQNSLILAPQINSLPKLTNQAKIDLSGSTEKNCKVELYLNETLYDEVIAGEDGSFNFSGVVLNEGENSLYAVAVKDEGEKSPPSGKVTLTADLTDPDLLIETPSDQEEFEGDQNTCQIQGKTEAGVFLTINEHQAIVDNAGRFSHSFTLEEGKNSIEVIAKDEAGNETKAKLSIFYSPGEEE